MSHEPPEDRGQGSGQRADDACSLGSTGTRRADSPSPSAKEDCLRASRTQRAFLAHMSHELRTPLNAIIGYSEMLVEDAADTEPDEWVRDLRRIQDAGKMLLVLVDDLLDPTKFDRKHALDLAAVGVDLRHQMRTPLNAVIGYSEMLLEEARDRGQETFVPGLQKIHAGGSKLLSLIDDVLRFARDGTVSTARAADDTGVSTMVRDAMTAIRPLDDGQERSDARVGLVLLVDDNETNRDLLSRRLERQGHTVATAENGREALEMIQSRAREHADSPFDLVLLDIMMPEMNGYQVLQQLKADPTLRHIPVIMISALDEIDSIVRCIEIGAEDYLPKPFDPVLLQARIGACLDKKRLRDREVHYLHQIEHEKKRYEDLLHVILPHEIVEELRTTNQVRPRLHEGVAVLFCDIVAFTPYCEHRQPEQVLAHLQEMVEAYEQLALQYEMEKIKTIGDAFMATAGLLKPVENPVLNSVRCGLEMISVARRLTAKWDVRVGIHIGPVMAGVVGHQQYLFDLWGATVNTASRVESHGVNGSVNLSQAAWQCVSDHCRGESLGLISLKGTGEVEIFRVDGVRGQSEQVL